MLNQVTKSSCMTRADGRKRTDALFFQHRYQHLWKMDKKAFESEVMDMVWALVALVALACFRG